MPNCPPERADGPLHVPDVDGVPPNRLNRFSGLPVVQTVELPFVPADADGFTVKL